MLNQNKLKLMMLKLSNRINVKKDDIDDAKIIE